MGINWEDILNCHDGDKIQDAYEDEMYENSSFRESIPDPGDDNDESLKYPVHEMLYEAYYNVFDYIIAKCKEKNMSENQIKDFFQKNLDYNINEIEDELDEDNHYGYVSKDLYRASELFYNMLRYIMRYYEHETCTKESILSFFADSDDKFADDYVYLINEMSNGDSGNGIAAFAFAD